MSPDTGKHHGVHGGTADAADRFLDRMRQTRSERIKLQLSSGVEIQSAASPEGRVTTAEVETADRAGDILASGAILDRVLNAAPRGIVEVFVPLFEGARVANALSKRLDDSDWLEVSAGVDSKRRVRAFRLRRTAGGAPPEKRGVLELDRAITETIVEYVCWVLEPFKLTSDERRVMGAYIAGFATPFRLRTYDSLRNEPEALRHFVETACYKGYLPPACLMFLDLSRAHRFASADVPALRCHLDSLSWDERWAAVEEAAQRPASAAERLRHLGVLGGTAEEVGDRLLRRRKPPTVTQPIGPVEWL